MRLPRRALTRGENTVALPSVDLFGDLDAIRRGEGWYDASTRRIWVHDRLYGQHDDGQLFPIRGEGFVEMDRQTYRALAVIRQYNGDMERALFQIEQDPYITDAQRDAAIRIWKVRESAKREQP